MHFDWDSEWAIEVRFGIVNPPGLRLLSKPNKQARNGVGWIKVKFIGNSKTKKVEKGYLQKNIEIEILGGNHFYSVVDLVGLMRSMLL